MRSLTAVESRDKGHQLRLVGILQIDLEIITLSCLRDTAVAVTASSL